MDNAEILDDQWLGTLLETGVLGVIAWVWLFGRAIRRLGARAKLERDTPEGWLPVAIAASLAGFVASMWFYDAFSFTQGDFPLASPDRVCRGPAAASGREWGGRRAGQAETGGLRNCGPPAASAPAIGIVQYAFRNSRSRIADRPFRYRFMSRIDPVAPSPAGRAGQGSEVSVFAAVAVVLREISSAW